MVALSHALEDELSLRAEPGVLVGAFQERRFFAEAEPRWRALARGARLTVVFADFARPQGDGSERPARVPIAVGASLEREWVVVHVAARTSAVLVGRQLPHGERRSAPRFEVGLEPRPARRARRRRTCGTPGAAGGPGGRGPARRGARRSIGRERRRRVLRDRAHRTRARPSRSEDHRHARSGDRLVRADRLRARPGAPRGGPRRPAASSGARPRVRRRGGLGSRWPARSTRTHSRTSPRS